MTALRSFAAAPAGYAAVSIALALLYFALAKIGLRLALLHPSATSVSATIGVGVFTLGGYADPRDFGCSRPSRSRPRSRGRWARPRL